MKNFLTSLIFCTCCYLVNAQQTHFIYLQTENKQPFFVKLNNKTLNSSSGYLIIPNLDEGLYSLVIGFPDVSSEQEFNCSIKNKDVGFIIKNTGQQWQLLNVQTLNVIVPGDVITKPVIAYEKETDPFSTMLANAVHDSTILRKDVATQIFTKKPVEVVIKDTAQTIASVNDIAVSGIKDTTQTVVSGIKDTTQTAVSKPDNILPTDSAKDIAKEIVPEKIIDLNKKDTALTINPNEIVIAKPGDVTKPDSLINNEVATIPAEKPNEVIQKDSVQTVPSNEVAVTKSKKKKSKKNENALQDSTVQQYEIAQVIPEKIDQNKDAPQAINSNNEVALLRSVIKRKSRKTSKDGMEMMYIDDNGESKDTIRILIPSDKKQKKDDEINSAPVVSVPVTEPDNSVKDAAGKKKSDDAISKQEKEIIKEANKDPVFISTMINSDCKSVATENDFLKMRKKMVAEENDEDMIKAARKIFKTKCFTTEQIKNLSVLFLKDEGKYMFFDAAYPFASDSDQYPTLEKQLSDNYYITRFRAMIHK